MVEILVPFFFFVTITAIASIVISSIRQILLARSQATVQARLLDKLPSAESLLAYTETASGRNFLSSISELHTTRTSPFKTILNGVQAAILLSVFGITLLLLHEHHALPDPSVLVFGAISLALGIGFALAAGATWLLSSSFGLLSPHKLP
jgi:hypothetical protein